MQYKVIDNILFQTKEEEEEEEEVKREHLGNGADKALSRNTSKVDDSTTSPQQD